MDNIRVMQASIGTSIDLKFYKNIENASLAHIYKSVLTKLPLSLFRNVDNFNPDRLQKSAIKAYPINNRPRGKDNIDSVKFYQKQIKHKKDISPIWLKKKK